MIKKSQLLIVLGLALLLYASCNNFPFKQKGENTSAYYVDPDGDDTNNGTSPNKAWQTLTKVNGHAYNPGDSILFKKDGIWYGQLMPIGSGRSGNPIVIDQYGLGAGKPTIDALGTTDNDGAVLRLYNQEYWEINNLNLTNYSDSGNWRAGILVLAKDFGTANHIYIKNCELHDIQTITKSSFTEWKKPIFETPVYNDNVVNKMWGNSSGIDFRSLRGDRNKPTNFNDILIQGNTIKNITEFGHAIAMTSEWSDPTGSNAVWGELTYSTNVIVQNNLMTGFLGFGAINMCTFSSDDGISKIEGNLSDRDGTGACAIWIYVAKGVLIQYNEVRNNKRDVNGNDCGAFDADGLCDGNIFQYNYSNNNDGEPYMLCNTNWEGWHKQQYCKNNIIRYNISQRDGKQSSRASFLVVSEGSNDNFIYNNTIYIPSNNSTPIINYHGSSDNNKFYNNIIYNFGSGIYNISGSGNVFDFNCFYGNHPINEPTDDHKSTADPLLANPGSGSNGRNTLNGYKLQAGSPSIDNGIIILRNGGLDFWGNAVKTENPDRGAHEY